MAVEYSIDNELLISLVKQKAVLWDKTIELYKNRGATQAAWKEIFMTLIPDFETREEKTKETYAKMIILRWTHLRDSYNRSYKKIQHRKRLGNGAKTIKPYVYSKKLRFLEKLIPNEPVSNVITESNNTESENQENNSETSDESDVNSIETKNFVTKNIVTKNPPPKQIPKRPSKEEVDPVDAKMLKIMNYFLNKKPKVTNRHLSFYNGILPMLEKFDENEVLDFQMGVLQLIKKIKSSSQNRELQS